MTRKGRAEDYAEHNIGKYTNEYANIYNAYLKGAEEETKELENEIIRLKDLLIELYDCIPSSMADSCRETLQKVALVFKED